jgi:adenylate cyclase, class 2
MKASPNNNWETEIKLALRDPQDGRRRLRAAGFRVHKKRIFEENTLFDTPSLKLRKAQSLLRVRQAGPAFKITYKGRPLSSDLKSREELETTIESHEAMAAILGRLGFAPVFRYQKYRTELRQRPGAGTATLDETPIGAYLELEGSPAWIRRTARMLGFSSKDYITASYGKLYLDWCKHHRVKPGDMVF